ncbi:Carboxylic ester hydrolase, partial [Gryllus bimaculatus]
MLYDLIVFILLMGRAWCLAGPSVQVREGLLRGKEVVSTLGLNYYSFQGVPYATPPLGALRFK